MSTLSSRSLLVFPRASTARRPALPAALVACVIQDDSKPSMSTWFKIRV
jgi:hypothetical protein